MGSTALLSFLVSVANKSGAIPPAPHGLIPLKQAIQGVPFQLLVKGMSGVITPQNLLQGVMRLATQMGGLQNVGNFSQILSQVSSVAKNPAELVRVASSLGVGTLTQAVGDVTALTASLSQFAPAASQVTVDQAASVPPPAAPPPPPPHTTNTPDGSAFPPVQGFE